MNFVFQVFAVVILLLGSSSASFAGRKSGDRVLSIVVSTIDQKIFKLAAEWMVFQEYNDDEQSRSVKPTDWRLKVVDKRGKAMSGIYLLPTQSRGIGDGVPHEIMSVFDKGYYAEVLLDAKPLPYKLEFYFKKVLKVSKLVSEASGQ